MSAARDRLNRDLFLVLGGYALCLAIAIMAVMIWDSGILMGIALAGILGVFAYARRSIRCPLCNTAVFLAPAPAALRFLMSNPRRCPRCRTDFEQATTLVKQPTSGPGRQPG